MKTHALTPLLSKLNKTLRSNLDTLLISSIIAWIWLGLTIMHIVLMAFGEWHSVVWEIFDKIVLYSNFLLFSLHGLLQVSSDLPADLGILPFTVQFLFWWGFGYLLLKIFRFLRPSDA